MKIYRPLLLLDKDADLNADHRLVCSNLDILELGLKYNDVVESRTFSNTSLLRLKLSKSWLLTMFDFFLATNFARILAAKLYSADVEHFISFSGTLKDHWLLKNGFWNWKFYLYIQYNMSDIEVWDLLLAVILWLHSKSSGSRDLVKMEAQYYFNGIL